MTFHAPCATCQGLLTRPHETILDKTPARYTYATLVATARECPLCFWIFKWLGSSSSGPETDVAKNGHVLATLHSGEYDEEVDCHGHLVQNFDTLRMDIELWPQHSTDFVASFRIILRALVKGSNGYEAVIRYANDLFAGHVYPQAQGK